MLRAPAPILAFAGTHTPMHILRHAWLPCLLLAQGLGAQVFFTGRQVESSLGPDVFAPTLTQNELYILFASRRAGGAGGFDLWEARRTSLVAPWNAPTPVAQLNSAADDTEPALSRDGLELYFTSSRSIGGLGPSNVLRSTRIALNAPWGPPAALGGPVNLTGVSNHDPRLSSNGLTLFYASNVGGGADLFTVVRSSVGGPWQNRQPLPGLNTGAVERSPLPDGDGGILYFASDRPGGNGGLDIYLTWRSGNGYTTPILIPELSSPADDLMPWVGAVSGRMYLSSFQGVNSSLIIWCPVPVHGGIDGRAWQATALPAPTPAAPIVAMREYQFSTTQPGDSTAPIDWYDWLAPPPPEGALLLLSVGPNTVVTVPGFRSAFALNPSAFVSLGFFPVLPNHLANIPPIPVPRDQALIGFALDFQVAWLYLQSLTGAFSDVVRLRLTP